MRDFVGRQSCRIGRGISGSLSGPKYGMPLHVLWRGLVHFPGRWWAMEMFVQHLLRAFGAELRLLCSPLVPSYLPGACSLRLEGACGARVLDPCLILMMFSRV